MASNLILTVFHQEESSSEQIGNRLKAKGYQLERCCLAEGDRLPQSLDRYAGIITFGGSMSANDDLKFIRDELSWLPHAIETEIPLLGICLGAQLISLALGGKVRPRDDRKTEIGYFPVYPTEAGQALLGPVEGLAKDQAEDEKEPPLFYHWNSEGFSIPEGAEALATGELFYYQAFRYGQSTYAFQFHPEITAEMIQRHFKTAGELLERPEAATEQKIWRDHERQAPKVAGWIDRFLEVWLREAVRPQAGPETGLETGPETDPETGPETSAERPALNSAA